MKTVLVAVNARYIHTNPAVRSIRAFAKQRGAQNIALREFSVNTPARIILRNLVSEAADLYIFSCYIWNIDLIASLARDLRAVSQTCVIAAGGPQVSWGSASFLAANPAFDGVLRGEGEASVFRLISLVASGLSPAGCPGVTWRSGDAFTENPPLPPLSMDDLPFPWDDFSGLADKILYYESMRGCPFSCSYCLSSAEEGVRMRSLPLVFDDLDRFLAARVRQVKFVDRTFNCDRERAASIWRYLMDHDNGVTNFHFELAGDLPDDGDIALLSGARPGLFQFEIGVQSLNPDTLREIRRPFSFGKIARNVSALRQGGNIHLHLDLIAGLPFEGYDSFLDSFDGVYALRPDQLQAGFLKLLPGSLMESRAEHYGLVCSENPPFEILTNKWIGYAELQALHDLEEMVDLYYNSGRFSMTIEYILSFFPRPSSFYLAFAAFYRARGFESEKPNKTVQYELLFDFMQSRNIPVDDHVKWLCKYDILRTEKPRKFPRHIDVDLSETYHREIRAFYRDESHLQTILSAYAGDGAKHASRVTHLEVFPFHPLTKENGPVFVLFDYRADRVHFVPPGG